MGSLPQDDQIETVDMSAFVGDASPEEKQRTAKEFAEKCARSGCLRITGHNIPMDLIREAFAVTAKFYELPLEDKMKAPHPAGFMPHRGYSGVGGEKAALKYMYERDEDGNKIGPKDEDGHYKNIDYKETWDMGSDGNKEQQNNWPPEDILPGFREFTTKFYWELAKMSNNLTNMMLAGLGLEGAEAQAIRDIHKSDDYHHLRLLHYLPVPASKKWEEDEDRLGAHTDLCSYTVGFQNSAGIQYLDRKTDKWLDPVVDGEAMYLNVGDVMTRISNDHYPGGMHRVTTPKPGPDGVVPPRESIVYFVSPAFGADMVTPKSLIERDGKAHYENMTVQDFLKDKFES